MTWLVTVVILGACVVAGKCAWVKEMENEGLWQGDIVLDPDEYEATWNRTQHTVYASIKGGRWPRGRVPYVIDSSLGSRARRVIETAISNYHKYTCLRFFPRTNERTYIRYYKGKGCSSPVGYRSGRVNSISLAPGCWHTGIVMHETGHSMGKPSYWNHIHKGPSERFFHEQSRPDRDEHVRIMWDNISKGHSFNFNKFTTKTIDSLGTPYDYESMMHYGSTAFSTGWGRKTIVTKDPSKQRLIGQRNGFSEIDKKQLGLMYKKECGGQPGGQKTDPPVTSAPGGCDNKNPRCEEWAKRGECEKNKFWMKANCCKACKEHSEGGGGQKTDPPVTQPPGGCDNKNPRCEEWAKRGECLNSHGRWMSQNCCKACKEFACPGACVNKDKRCDEWAGRGDCNNGHGPWMRCNCCVSCKGK